MEENSDCGLDLWHLVHNFWLEDASPTPEAEGAPFSFRTGGVGGRRSDAGKGGKALWPDAIGGANKGVSAVGAEEPGNVGISRTGTPGLMAEMGAF